MHAQPTPPRETTPTPDTARQQAERAALDVERAVFAYDAMQAHFFDADALLYRDARPCGGDGFAYLWPFSQAMTATLDVMAIPEHSDRFQADATARQAGSERFWSEYLAVPAFESCALPPWGIGGDVYYDDNAWAGLAQLQLYQLTGDEQALIRARATFDLLVSGWDSNPDHPAPGGIFWVAADWNWDRNTVSTAPAALLGLRLSEFDPDSERQPYYIEWATRMYNWVMKEMRADNGLFWDRIDLEGGIDERQFSYNQGSMIGANVAFFHLTGETVYLTRANEIAVAALDMLRPEALLDQSIAFNAIFFRHILDLHKADPNPDYLSAAQTYADLVWDTQRNASTGLIDITGTPELLDQAAVVQLYATLATASAEGREVAGAEGGTS